MERAVQLFAAVNFLVMGLSHLIQPHAWVDFFISLREKGNAGAFVNGFLTLGFGSFIVAFHNVWSGLPLILTVYGWALVVKALVIFLVPGVALRTLRRVSHERSRQFAVPGVALLLLGGLLTYHLLTEASF